jgi:endonuclease/exonuclease/phosphatase family metal-dependent hydrolase
VVFSQNVQQPSLTLATYNIHRCIGRDGKFDPDRIISIVNLLQADVIALQEVETREEGGLDLLDQFRRQTGMQTIAGPTMFNAGARYGNAILIRKEYQDLQRLDISVANREPRGAVSLLTQAGEQTIHLVATHLGLLPSERRTQVQSLLEIFRQKPADISVLMGDLNEWYLWGRPLRWLRKHFTTSPAPPTFPARFPLLALDRIWVQPQAYLHSIAPVSNTLTRIASDHLPLKGTLIF